MFPKEISANKRVKMVPYTVGKITSLSGNAGKCLNESRHIEQDFTVLKARPGVLLGVRMYFWLDTTIHG